MWSPVDERGSGSRTDAGIIKQSSAVCKVHPQFGLQSRTSGMEITTTRPVTTVLRPFITFPCMGDLHGAYRRRSALQTGLQHRAQLALMMEALSFFEAVSRSRARCRIVASDAPTQAGWR